MAKTIPISVVMPVYNSDKYMREAIESILNQTFQDFEFIIIDDGSTDMSLEIALDYQKHDARIQVHCHEQNKGIVKGRNAGLQLAKGKYIAWMDSDDISVPERLTKQYLFMQSHPDIGVTSANAIMIDESGKSISVIQMPQTHNLILWAFCFYDPIINPAVMANRELCIQIGGYRDLAKDRTEYFPEDYDLWVRISKHTHFRNFNEPLLKLRKHSQNITKTRLQSTLKNSSLICHAYLQSVSENEISETLVQMIWGIATPPSLRGMPQFIKALYTYFTNLPEILPQEKEYIRKDASQRLVNMAKKHIWDPHSLPTLVLALRINPRLAVSFIKRKLLKP